MKITTSFLVCLLICTIASSCTKTHYTTVFDKSTGSYKKVPREEAFKQKILTPAEIEAESKRLDAQGYR